MRGHTPFNNDVSENGRYIYTGPDARKSAISANLSQSKLIAEGLAKIKATSVLDLGCGDGTFTREFYDLGIATIIGFDPAEEAINFANNKFAIPGILSFTSSPISDITLSGEKFDCVVLRGVLHHCENPADVLKQATFLGKYVIVLEPNGLNPIMKLIEKASRYHREHSERSFSRFRINKWFQDSGFKPIQVKVGILVPFFFPDILVAPLSKIEKVMKKIPIIRWVYCGTQIFIAEPINS